jgi:hypothetical protein
MNNLIAISGIIFLVIVCVLIAESLGWIKLN